MAELHHFPEMLTKCAYFTREISAWGAPASCGALATGANAAGPPVQSTTRERAARRYALLGSLDDHWPG